MGMFLNYQNIANSYPNNLVNAFPSCDICSKLNPLEASKPYEEYNIKGDLIGYFWRYGETLNLEFDIDGEKSAIITKYYDYSSDYVNIQNYAPINLVFLHLYPFFTRSFLI